MHSAPTVSLWTNKDRFVKYWKLNNIPSFSSDKFTKSKDLSSCFKAVLILFGLKNVLLDFLNKNIRRIAGNVVTPVTYV